MTTSGIFKLFDSHDTHNQVLYRRRVFDSGKFIENEDLLIKGTAVINLPFSMNGFNLRLGSESELTAIEKAIGEFSKSNKKLFVFETNNGHFYVLADAIQYQKNKIPNNSTSIPSKLEAPLSETDILDIVRRTKENPEKAMKDLKSSNWVNLCEDES